MFTTKSSYFILIHQSLQRSHQFVANRKSRRSFDAFDGGLGGTVGRDSDARGCGLPLPAGHQSGTARGRARTWDSNGLLVYTI